MVKGRQKAGYSHLLSLLTQLIPLQEVVPKGFGSNPEVVLGNGEYETIADLMKSQLVENYSGHVCLIDCFNEDCHILFTQFKNGQLHSKNARLFKLLQILPDMR